MAKPRRTIIVVVCFFLLAFGALRWNFSSPFTRFYSPLTISAKDLDFNATYQNNAATTLQRTMIGATAFFNKSSDNQSVYSDENTAISIQYKAPAPDSTFDPESTVIESDNNITYDNETLSNLTKTCFAFNSHAWLQGPRIGNIPIPNKWIDHMMYPHRLLYQPTIHAIFDQTLCYKTGRFRNISQAYNATDVQQIRDWEFRLFYLALHRHVHMAAFPEYQQRVDCGLLSPKSSSLPFGLHNFDYECPQTKFLVTVLGTRAGMGAVIKNAVMPSIFMAFATGRIPLFVQAVRGNGIPDVLTQPLLLSSCDRRDWQCVFLPTSPCVLTIEDLKNGTVLNADESRDLKNRGYFTETLNATRVVISGAFSSVPFNGRFSIHDKIRVKVSTAVNEILDDWKNDSSSSGYDIPAEQWNVLTAAAEAIAVPYTKDSASEDRKFRYLRAALFYVMRPNPMARREIDQQLQHVLPKQNETLDRQYYGLPIRGSDKCRFESTCLPFDRYMELMLFKLHQHGTPDKRGTILLTSEDPQVLPLRHAYVQNTSFPLDFLINDRDVQPGTGKSTRYYDRADAIVISSLVVIKLQLFSNVLVGNCCSNFHKLLFELVSEGCGADPHVVSECLNGIEDPRFLICCGWTKEGTCQQIWAEHRARGSAAAAATAAAAAVMTPEAVLSSSEIQNTSVATNK